MRIICANEIEYNPREQISEICVEGFYQWLKFFSKDKKKLVNAFAHMFNLDVFHTAIVDDKIVGIAALNDNTKHTIQLSKSELQKHLGFIMGFISYKILKHEFEDKSYPFEFKPGTAYVEFVATSPQYRGKGVASGIINHFFNSSEYSEFVLEVADTNVNAVKLYEKLGFKEFMRVEMKDKKHSGINNLLYMKYRNDSLLI